MDREGAEAPLVEGEVHADAGVRPGAEAEVITGAAQHIEPIGVGVFAFVAVCGPVEHDGA